MTHNAFEFAQYTDVAVITDMALSKALKKHAVQRHYRDLRSD